jgi:hypothetical protein
MQIARKVKDIFVYGRFVRRKSSDLFFGWEEGVLVEGKP